MRAAIRLFSSLRGTTMSTCPYRSDSSDLPNPSGSFSLVVCSITRGPAKERKAPGSAIITSANVAKLASTPPVVGSARTETKGRRLSRRSSRATTVLAICMRDRMPSCMRAPPEEVTMTSATLSATARFTSLTIASPTTEPMDPPRKRKSSTPKAAGCWSICTARQQGLSPTGGSLGGTDPVCVGAKISEAQRVQRLELGPHLAPAAKVGQLGDPLQSTQGTMIAAERADIE